VTGDVRLLYDPYSAPPSTGGDAAFCRHLATTRPLREIPATGRPENWPPLIPGIPAADPRRSGALGQKSALPIRSRSVRVPTPSDSISPPCAIRWPALRRREWRLRTHGSESNRLGKVLKDAGLPVTVFGARATTHNRINADLGMPDDPATQALFEFLDKALKK